MFTWYWLRSLGASAIATVRTVFITGNSATIQLPLPLVVSDQSSGLDVNEF